MRDARIDVVVVAFRSAETLAPALDSVVGARLVERVLVVDNASPDGSAAVAADAGADEVLRNGDNRGFAAAVNQALAGCTSEFVLLLNPDAAVEDECLQHLVDSLDADPRAVCAGPLLVEADAGVILGAHRYSTLGNRLARLLPLTRRFRRLGPYYTNLESSAGDAARRASRPLPVDYLWGAALLCRRSFLIGIGGLDERFFLYSEDEDLGRQAACAGRTSLLVPAARAAHVGGHSSRGIQPLAAARLQYANAQLLAKWQGRGRAVVFLGGALAAYGVRILIARARGDRPAEAQARETRRALQALIGGADPSTGAGTLLRGWKALAYNARTLRG
jgi:N-acetylglucosaminyl-diphospho-decaprenol L-rhamnosyltransferase